VRRRFHEFRCGRVRFSLASESSSAPKTTENCTRHCRAYHAAESALTQEGGALAPLPPFPSSSMLGGVGDAGEGSAVSTLHHSHGFVLGRGGSDPAVIEVSARVCARDMKIRTLIKTCFGCQCSFDAASPRANYMSALLSPVSTPAWIWQCPELVAFLDSPLGTLTAQANYARLTAAQVTSL